MGVFVAINLIKLAEHRSSRSPAEDQRQLLLQKLVELSDTQFIRIDTLIDIMIAENEPEASE